MAMFGPLSVGGLEEVERCRRHVGGVRIAEAALEAAARVVVAEAVYHPGLDHFATLAVVVVAHGDRIGHHPRGGDGTRVAGEVVEAGVARARTDIAHRVEVALLDRRDRKSTRLNS